MPEKHDICAIDEIPDNEARGFTLKIDSGEHEFFIVRKNDQLYGYINRCPHTGVTLNWQPDQFLNMDGDLVQCSTHGARFQIEDGYCVFGPCAGQSLKPVSLDINDGRIFLIIDKDS